MQISLRKLQESDSSGVKAACTKLVAEINEKVSAIRADDEAAGTPKRQAEEQASLSTKKSKKKKKRRPKAGANAGTIIGGFGGAAMESCPCGSGETYSSCCSKVHKDVQFFRKASAEQIVRARYSAYSRKLPEFLMMSTHPNNAAFNPDLREWKKSIK